jgi:hypothetical protein
MGLVLFGLWRLPNTISPGLGSIKLGIVEVLKDNFIRKLTLMSFLNFLYLLNIIH